MSEFEQVLLGILNEDKASDPASASFDLVLLTLIFYHRPSAADQNNKSFRFSRIPIKPLLSYARVCCFPTKMQPKCLASF
jgi:hypothetical protein